MKMLKTLRQKEKWRFCPIHRVQNWSAAKETPSLYTEQALVHKCTEILHNCTQDLWFNKEHCRVCLWESKQWEQSSMMRKQMWDLRRRIKTRSRGTFSLSLPALPSALQPRRMRGFKSQTLNALLPPHTDSTGLPVINQLSRLIQISSPIMWALMVFSFSRGIETC